MYSVTAPAAERQAAHAVAVDASRTPTGSLLEGGLDALDLVADEPLGDARDDVGDRVADDAVAQALEDLPGDALDEVVDRRPAAARPGR